MTKLTTLEELSLMRTSTDRLIAATNEMISLSHSGRASEALRRQAAASVRRNTALLAKIPPANLIPSNASF